MRPVTRLFAWIVFFGLLGATNSVWSAPNKGSEEVIESAGKATHESCEAESSITKLTRIQVLVGSLTVFTLAVIVGFEIIAKVPPTLHTPLMSGSNAISGITVVGALIAAGNQQGGFASFLGLVAVILANINVVGGFWVTHRMLLMFKKK